MTSEQAREHREVIKRFVEAPHKGVWRKNFKSHSEEEWELTIDPCFSVDVTYVTNDEWAEISRQFFDDRSKVEVLFNGKWVETACKNVEEIRTGSIEEYRIKPKEPKFKIGDWVVNTIGKNNRPERVAQYNLDKISGYYDDFVSWKPVEGKLVVFWNKDTPNERVIRLYDMCLDSSIGIRHMDIGGETWEQVAPLEVAIELNN